MKQFGFDGYSGRIEIVGVYFIDNARAAETAISRLFKNYRIERDHALEKFGTYEIYQLTQLDIEKIHHVLTGVFMGLVQSYEGCF